MSLSTLVRHFIALVAAGLSMSVATAQSVQIKRLDNGGLSDYIGASVAISTPMQTASPTRRTIAYWLPIRISATATAMAMATTAIRI